MSAPHIREASVSFEEFTYRTPMKFRATLVDRVTLLNTRVVMEAPDGRYSVGCGSMTLGNVWAFPSTALSHAETLHAMKEAAVNFAEITSSHRGSGHPIELSHQLEPLYLSAAPSLPPLATLVTASAIDAATHDAYGKLLGANCYQLYGAEFVTHDLSRYLDSTFAGEFPDRYISTTARPSLHIYHAVGASDPLTEADITTRLNDGKPETLRDWAIADQLDHAKIKLDGDDLAWDLNRVLSIDRVLSEVEPARDWYYSLDFNERCKTVEYVLECFAKLQEQAPRAFDRIQFIEQPTSRNLNAPGTPSMHQAAKIKPVVIDESLVDYATFLRARELGYSGVALKACKGQSNALLMAAASQKFGMYTCMQDLTCPGASLLQSISIAAHVPPVDALECNSRQYVPSANVPWEARFPSVFDVQHGEFQTAGLDGPGLGIFLSSTGVSQ
jgi:L-alanine-DL-glutamate epimerase-like enolase superfamily enzyme